MTPPFPPLHIEVNPVWQRMLCLTLAVVIPFGFVAVGLYLMLKKLRADPNAARRKEETARVEAMLRGTPLRQNIWQRREYRQ